tara:strand:+ start:1173 stop:1532 length:360 start_codon:yes stop_codon:yes gene_type:complete
MKHDDDESWNNYLDQMILLLALAGSTLPAGLISDKNAKKEVADAPLVGFHAKQGESVDDLFDAEGGKGVFLRRAFKDYFRQKYGVEDNLNPKRVGREDIFYKSPDLNRDGLAGDTLSNF